MEGEGTSGEAKSPDDRGVKTLRIRGERKCLVINVKPGSIICNDCYKVVDNGDCVDLVREGKIAELPIDGERASRARINCCIWMAGSGFKAEKKIENGKLIVYTPPCISSFPKKEIDSMSAEQVLNKIKLDLRNFTSLEMGKVKRSLNINREIQVVLAKEESSAGNKEEEEVDEDAPNKPEETPEEVK